MPHVIPADAENFSIFKTIESKVKVPVAYRTRQCDMLSVPESTSFIWRLSVKTAPEKPRFIIVGFQTAKDDNQTKNPSSFDHVNLKKCFRNAKLRSIPRIDYNLSFANQKFSRVYGNAAWFGMDELITQSNITPSDYKTLYLFSRSMSSSRKKNSNPLLLIFE